MKSNEVDMHIHSYYSDGALMPKEILEEALKKKLKLISIADHNVLKGTEELINLQSQYPNIKLVPGVEIDTLDNETNYHILAYNFDLSNKSLLKFVNNIFEIKESINIKLIEMLEKKYPDKISLKEYLNYDYNKEEGYWKALHYLYYKGLTESLSDGKKLYKEYGPIEPKSPLPTIKETCKVIHEAGGIAILAHPGKVLKKYNLSDFQKEVERIIKQGINGIECYYPTHSEEVINKCVELCQKYNLRITAGSDFHRRLGSREIGNNSTNMGILKYI